jgi:hypothetical protein
VKTLEVLEYPEIVLSQNPGKESAIELQKVFLEKVRGTNFRNGHALIFSDSHESQWLWKKVDLSILINEFIISFLAHELGIRVPTSLIAKRGHSLGLLQKWVSDAVELSSYTKSQPKIANKEEILDLIIFSAWIGANDRHASNHIYSDGKLYAIDFEDSFSGNIQGNEICLYFPWIKESKIMEESLIKMKIRIKEKKILQKLENFVELATLKEDNRAKKAVKDQLTRILSLLNENLNNFEKVVENYIARSISPSKLFDLF